MKKYNVLMFLSIGVFAAGMIMANTLYISGDSGDKLYNVEANRLMDVYQQKGAIPDQDIEACQLINAVEFLPADAPERMEDFFYDGGYLIRLVYQDDLLMGYFKFTYQVPDNKRGGFLLWQNIILAGVFLGVVLLLIYIKKEIIQPLHVFESLPAALAKGDYTRPVRVEKGRFFGRFLWGLDMLRETLLKERSRSLWLEKEKTQIILALAHDIKTPLGTILLCSKALNEGLYGDPHKQKEMLTKIDKQALKIQQIIQKLQEDASEEMLDLPVEMGEFYLDDFVKRVEEAYRWRMDLTDTELYIQSYENCLLFGDEARAYEALCNLLENAMKYGDGKRIEISLAREEGCQLITVINTGGILAPTDAVHMFESFWRGANAQGKQGNGLGLFVARRLLVRMGGEAFAHIDDDVVSVTLVFKLNNV
ncbi:MAG: HAMP domain-containing histidine kinase [Peptococcaceae bacterium]|nr:HAMP domain-containing histidine kinase [Peptococcaceae bacterium]